MKKLSIVSIVAVAIVILGLAALVYVALNDHNCPVLAGGTGNQTANSSSVSLIADNGSVVKLQVEIADTLEEQTTGLMNRSSLAEDAGMLFVWDNDVRYDFWMEDTLIPLDMIFIAGNLTVIDIHENATPLSTDHISSSHPYRYVLEVNGGLCAADDIDIGDRVSLDLD